MSEREEYTPSMDHVRNRYARIMKTDGTVALAIRWQKEFDRWLAAHDRALREQIAEEIEAKADEPDPRPYEHLAYNARKEQTDE